MARPRVLLVDDDASIRRFVEMALDEMEIELICCDSVAHALDTLRRAPVSLLMTDLMMPVQSGFDLLQQLADAPALRGDARLAVFSAGLTQAVQARLANLGVWRQLSKPISVVELESCVREAILPAPVDAAPPGMAPGLGDDELAAVAHLFAGDRALFEAFRATCLQQFEADLLAGESAVTAGDAPALHRLAHSLKSVLRTLGHGPLADLARELEEAAAAARWDQAAPLWARLRTGLTRLAHPDA